MSAVHVAKLEYDASGTAPAQGVPEAQGSKWAKSFHWSFCWF